MTERSDPTRVVFDCNFFVQALASADGPAGRCVQLAIDRAVRLFISSDVIRELREITARPRIVRKLKLIPDRIDEFIEAISKAATVLDGFPESFVYMRDPDDAHYVNLALAAGAKLIVSRDKDLLDLMDATYAESRQFRVRFPSLQIMNPVQFLREALAPPR